MIEGGNIDWHAHGNDAAAVVHEVADFDDAIAAAYNFYLAHPDETLIVVTADHETGSLNLGTGKYALNLKALSNQKVSQDEMSRIFNTIRRNNNGEISWEMARQAPRRQLRILDCSGAHRKTGKPTQGSLREIIWRREQHGKERI